VHPTVTEPSSDRPSRAQAPTVVGCILTRNEERNIARAVSSLLLAADAVVVVDSESDDGTRDIAEQLGATVWVHPFESYAHQRNWALDQIEAHFGDVWMLSIDADEWLSDELAAEIRGRTAELGRDADAYLLKRRTRFDGRVLRHGGFESTWITRLVPVGYARYEDRKVNEHLDLPEGARIGRFEGWLEHADVDSWARYVDKHNRYSTLEAEARIVAMSGAPSITFDEARRDPALRKRFLRERVFNRLPARPAIRFVQVYVASLGFLDGRSGFRRALFEAWQEMMTDLKAEELARQRRDGTPTGER
jgi:glycosyltransferase involved in cell wall biosynthesis